jgi:chaperonin cofactor prefoldin
MMQTETAEACTELLQEKDDTIARLVGEYIEMKAQLRDEIDRLKDRIKLLEAELRIARPSVR